MRKRLPGLLAIALLGACQTQVAPTATRAVRVTLAPSTTAEPAPTSFDPVSAATAPAPTPINPAPTPIDPAPTPIDPAPTPIDPAPTPIDPAPTAIDPPPTAIATSATPAPAVCERSAGRVQMLAEGLCVRQLIAAGPGFVRIERDSAGVPFLLNTKNQIYQLVFENESTSLRLFADASAIGGAPYTLGFAIGPDDAMYVVGNDTDGKNGRCTVRTNADGAWTTLAETAWYELSGTQYDHRCNGIVVSPDNQYIFFNSGSRTEHGEVQDNGGAFPGLRESALTSTVFRVPRSARGLVLPNDAAALKAGGYAFARGLRNAFDLAFDNTGRLLAVDNGPDADFPEELNVLVDGAHYGFPWRFGAQDNPQRDPAYDPQRDARLNSDFVAVQKGLYRNDPEFPSPPGALTDPLLNTGPDANQFRADDGGVQNGDLPTFTAHRSPLGLVWDTQGNLPGAFKHTGFVASWGSAGGTLSDRGQDLLHLRAAGADRLTVTRIARGFNRPIDAVLHGVVIYVLDWEGDGAVWEIRFTSG